MHLAPKESKWTRKPHWIVVHVPKMAELAHILAFPHSLAVVRAIFFLSVSLEGFQLTACLGYNALHWTIYMSDATGKRVL